MHRHGPLALLEGGKGDGLFLIFFREETPSNTRTINGHGRDSSTSRCYFVTRRGWAYPNENSSIVDSFDKSVLLFFFEES